MGLTSLVPSIFSALAPAGLTETVRVRRWTLDSNQDRSEVSGSPWTVDIVWEPAKPGQQITASVVTKPEDRKCYVPAASCPFGPLKPTDRIEFAKVASPSSDTDYESRPVVAVSSIGIGSDVVLYEVWVQ